MLAASLPDLDGLGILVSEDLYWDYHHFAGHNLFFGLLLGGLFAAFSGRRWLTFVACLACFHLHLAMDYIGSGPGWKIHYLWPLSDWGLQTDLGWPLDSWQNRVAFGVLLLMTLAIGFRKRITPLELLAPRLHRKLVGESSQTVVRHPGT
jgi:hypothetical protein